MNLAKRVKRHVIGVRHHFLAVTVPGFEAVCRKELKSLSSTLQIEGVIKAGVIFSGRLSDLYLANLYLRTASRILMRLVTFKATSFHQLHKHVDRITWSLYLPHGAVPECHVTSRHSRLYHTQAVTQRLNQTITAYWTRMAIQTFPSKQQRLFVRIMDDRVTLSLDSSGENLYRRGIKSHWAHAPLRETLAALILRLADYDPSLPLIDPMCGAGTFSLEAALIAKSIAPGSYRQFAFMQWPAFHPRQWDYLKNNAGQQVRNLACPRIWASDKNQEACRLLSGCIQQHRLEDAITVTHQNFLSLQLDPIHHQPGLVVLNPPYGRRLTAGKDATDFFHRIAARLRQNFKGWKAALLVPNRQIVQHIELPLKTYVIPHGGLELTLLTGRLN